jgi:hypothetical protein
MNPWIFVESEGMRDDIGSKIGFRHNSRPISKTYALGWSIGNHS